MASAETSGPLHPTATERRKLRYFFYVKHHRIGKSNDAQWSLSHHEEFDVFDNADRLDLSNDKGDLHGLRKLDDGTVDLIGTRGEQIAKFPVAPLDQAWHGYPCWPLNRQGEEGRKATPTQEELKRLVEAGVITDKQMRRLSGGKNI